jgi:hypothetical protein
MIAARGLNVQRRSLPLDGSVLQADVLLGDSMGEMFAYYAACDVRLRRRQPDAAGRPEPDRTGSAGQAV